MANSTNETGSEKPYGGTIPAVYEKYMVPMIFEPYSEHMAARFVTVGCLPEHQGRGRVASHDR